jgi:hypothetical protein
MALAKAHPKIRKWLLKLFVINILYLLVAGILQYLYYPNLVQLNEMWRFHLFYDLDLNLNLNLVHFHVFGNKIDDENIANIAVFHLKEYIHHH